MSYRNCKKCAGTGYIDYPKNTRECDCWKSKLRQLKEFGESGGLLKDDLDFEDAFKNDIP